MKWFCCSDIHGFFDEWMQSLHKAGFDTTNPNHGLIVCGDIFDRGNQPLMIYEFLKSFPKERRILIRGNHEILLEDLYKRGFNLQHDDHNGTTDTLSYIANVPTQGEFNKQIAELITDKMIVKDFVKIYDEKWSKIEYKRYHNRKIKEILKWFNSDEWVNYYETDKYIFVHSFIPLDTRYKMSGKVNEYNPKWREANQEQWNSAMWGCPWRLYLDYFEPEIKKGKTLVCGHWHTSDFWNNLDLEQTEQMDIRGENPIYKSDKYPNLIGLDACTALSKRVNILVLDSEEM